eukprot:3810598-Prymnesium_polylepis.1
MRPGWYCARRNVYPCRCAYARLISCVSWSQPFAAAASTVHHRPRRRDMSALASNGRGATGGSGRLSTIRIQMSALSTCPPALPRGAVRASRLPA